MTQPHAGADMPGSNPPFDPHAPHRRLGRTYWTCNVIEMWERLAYYTFAPVAAIYVAQADDPGGLHLTQGDKGFIFLCWSLVQSLLPIITGGLADRYGYRRVVIMALVVNMIGYGLMGTVHGYAGFFAGLLIMATGTAFFKPGLQGTLAHCLTKETSSLGWGIFYWIVNVGSFIGHMISPFLLGDHSQAGWRWMFYACAGFTFLNLVTLLWFPDVPSGASKTESVFSVLKRTITNVFEPRLLTFLLIMSCFWMMMYQLWDLLPNFIPDWVDTSRLAELAPFKSWKETGPHGELRVPQQVMLSLNAALIVMLVVAVSYVVRRMRTLSAMLIGMLGATMGVLVAGLTSSGWVVLLGIAFFSLSEMLTGPKKSEYLGLITPPGKKGLYLGYVNIPVGIGRGVGAWIAGMLYGGYGEKANLALKHLLTATPYGEGRTWDGSVATLEQAAGISRGEAFNKLQEVLGLDHTEATRLLWDTYHPQYYSWLPFAALGFLAAIALYIFGRMARKWSDMNA